MLNFYISLQIDDDFGVPQYNSWGTQNNTYIPDGIVSINGSFANINPKIFNNKDFFKPIESIIKNGINIEDLSQDDIENIMSKFGKYEMDSNVMKFDPNNFYDLDQIFIDKNERDTRISIRYLNCPINSFYLLQDGETLKVIISPFTKNYYTITETEWLEFLSYLNKEIGLSELRDIKLNQIFDEKPNKSINLIRQLRFRLNKNSDKFLNSVLDFYNKRGYLSDKQYNSVAKNIW